MEISNKIAVDEIAGKRDEKSLALMGKIRMRYEGYDVMDRI